MTAELPRDEVAEARARRGAPRPGGGPQWPEGARVIGDAAYVLGDPGAVYGLANGRVSRRVAWCPEVRRVLTARADDGRVTEWFYEIGIRGVTVAVSDTELREGRAWSLALAPGTGSKRSRELLVDVVLDQAAALEAEPAITRTGWHADGEGARFYVFADGRASDGRRVLLYRPAERGALASAAAEVPAAGAGDVAAALWAVAEHGRGPGLLGLAAGIRALGQSIRPAPGGVLAVGRKNSGKTSVGWHARLPLIARPDKPGAWPPLVSATFRDTPTAVEAAVDYEADMAALLDDAALHSGSTRTEQANAANLCELVFRSLFNGTPIRQRFTRTMQPQAARYVRALPIATLQELPPQIQGSLLTRALLVEMAPGDVDGDWYKHNGAGLVGAVRTLGERLVIPRLAGADAAAYLARMDAEALEVLGAALDASRPGWQTEASGIARVADIAAAVLAGMLIACDVLEMSPALAELLAEYLAGLLGRQAELLADEDDAAAGTSALGDILTAALLEARAHVCRSEDGAPYPAIPGLSATEQGLERLAAYNGEADYRGRGVPLYYRPETGPAGALGAASASLHSLVRRADDPRLPAGAAGSLPKRLVGLGAALPSAQRGSPYVWQAKVGGANRRLVMVPAELVTGPVDQSQEKAATPATPATAQVRGPKTVAGSEIKPATGPAKPATEPATGPVMPAEPWPNVPAAATAPGRYGRRDAASVLMDHGRKVSVRNGDQWHVDGERVTLEQLEALAREYETPAPAEARERQAPEAGFVPALAALEDLEAIARALEAEAAPAELVTSPVDQSPEKAARPAIPARPQVNGPKILAGSDPKPAREPAREPARAAEVPAEAVPLPDGPTDDDDPAAGPPPRPRETVRLGADGREALEDGDGPEDGAPGRYRLALAADGRAYGDGGEVITLPPGRLAEVTAAAADPPALTAALGALALELDTRQLWIPREVRELLGLPAGLPDVDAGHPHPLAEAAAGWQSWATAPAPAWVSLTRTADGARVKIVFPEWHAAAPWSERLAALAPAELAAALEMIHGATVRPSGRGGAQFTYSPAATFGHLLKQAARWSRRGVPEAVTLPPAFGEVRVPPSYIGPPAEGLAGWTLARLDVRSHYASALAGTPFGLGEPEHRQAAEGEPLELPASPAPGIVRVRVPAPALAAAHPALLAWLRPRRRGGPAEGWLDVLAARWLAERGVPLEVLESYTFPEHNRVFDTLSERLGAARTRLEADGSAPALAAAAAVKAMVNTFVGGWLNSTFGGARGDGDWQHRPDWRLTAVTQAEVRKQRNLLPALESGALVVLAGQAIDSVYVAARSPEALEAAPGAGKRRLMRTEDQGRGGFKIEGRTAEITPELAARLGNPRTPPGARLDAIQDALGEARTRRPRATGSDR